MPGYYGSPLTLAVVYAHMGDIDQAKVEAARTLTLFPDLPQQFPSIARIWYQDDQFRDYFIEGLRKAGLGIENVPASVD